MLFTSEIRFGYGYGLDLKFPAKAQVLKVWTPANGFIRKMYENFRRVEPRD